MSQTEHKDGCEDKVQRAIPAPSGSPESRVCVPSKPHCVCSLLHMDCTELTRTWWSWDEEGLNSRVTSGAPHRPGVAPLPGHPAPSWKTADAIAGPAAPPYLTCAFSLFWNTFCDIYFSQRKYIQMNCLGKKVYFENFTSALC